MSDWLYPLSSTSGFWFEMPDGSRTQDTSPANFEASVLRASPDDRWTIGQNYRRVEPGDRVWIYYGHADGDLGVVGLASVTHIDAPRDRQAEVYLHWDIGATKRLLLNPVPASRVRESVWPRAAVTGISSCPSLVRILLRHAESKRLRPASRPTKAVPSTITYTPPTRITAELRHDALIGPVQTRLETCGWVEAEFDVRPQRVDLAMRRGNDFLLLEFKTFRGASRQAVRDAFAQLHEYLWRHRDRHPRARHTISLWAVFESVPKLDEIRFLEADGLLVSWASTKARRLSHGAETLRLLASLAIDC